MPPTRTCWPRSSGSTAPTTARWPATPQEAEAIKLVARTHQSLIWDRTRHVLRLRSALREFFPAALEAFADLDAPDALELLAAAPDPDRRRAADQGQDHRGAAAGEPAQRRGQGRPDPGGPARRAAAPLTGRCRPPTPRSWPARPAIVQTLNAQIAQLGAVVAAHFGRHPDAEIYASQPGLGVVLARPGAGRVRRRPAPLRRRQGPQELRRHLPDHPGLRQEEDRAGPLRPQPPPRRRAAAVGVLLAARITRRPRLLPSSSAPASIGHQAALRQLANRLVGILHGCLKTRTRYDEHTAWSHHMTGAA